MAYDLNRRQKPEFERQMCLVESPEPPAGVPVDDGRVRLPLLFQAGIPPCGMLHRCLCADTGTFELMFNAKTAKESSQKTDRLPRPRMIGNLTAIVIFTYSTSAPFTKKSNNHLFNDFSPGGKSAGTKISAPLHKNHLWALCPAQICLHLQTVLSRESNRKRPGGRTGKSCHPLKLFIQP